MGALITLIAGIGLAALVVFFGPGLAEQAGNLLGEESSYPALETIATLIIFGALFLFALVGGAVAKLNPLRLGRDPLRMAAIGAAFGLGGLLAAAGYAWLAGAVEPGEPAPTGIGLLLWGTLIILFATAVEEIYFRGWLQPVLAARFGMWIAVLLAAFAFAGLHLMGGARSITALANLFLGGLLFGLLAARGGGIAGSVGAHFAYNWSEQIVLGADPNPGVGSFGAVVNYDLVGPALWGGSDEGLNASIAMTMALVAVLVPLIILMRSQPPAAGTPPIGGVHKGALGA